MSAPLRHARRPSRRPVPVHHFGGAMPSVVIRMPDECCEDAPAVVWAALGLVAVMCTGAMLLGAFGVWLLLSTFGVL